MVGEKWWAKNGGRKYWPPGKRTNHDKVIAWLDGLLDFQHAKRLFTEPYDVRCLVHHGGSRLAADANTC